MDDTALTIGLNDTITDAGIEESVNTVEEITQILEDGDVELHVAKQLHDHAHDLISHIETRLDVDGDITTIDELDE